jgi:hypothetical protein
MAGPPGLSRFNAGRHDNNKDDVMLSGVHLRTRASLSAVSKEGASVCETYGLCAEKTNCSVVLEVTAWLMSLFPVSIDTMNQSILETTRFVRPVWSSNRTDTKH